ncbi:MAG TPA: glutamate formiminotransferase, partial [Candidatus Tectomicrobia bacterium]|nr:glutamate formiminotransferase [Candidatus Tectomicrobia bacterium]
MPPGPIVECVPNVSEGRDPARLAAFADAIRAVPGATLADVHADPDHHRSVYTILGVPDAVAAAALALADVVLATVDMREHRGIHPRLGALDVVPFVPLAGVAMADAVALARRVGEAIARRHALPVYHYGEAATRPERRGLRELRHGEYEGLAA